jgi:hypothetical protein
MQLRLRPHEWDGGEAYTVHIDGGGERMSDAVGYLWRSAPDAFSFAPGDRFDPTTDGAPKIHCDTAAEAVKQVAEKLKAVELPTERMSNAQMYGVTGQMLGTLAALAKATDSRPGFISALASAVARSVVVDLRAESGAAFLRAFFDEVDANIKAQRTISSASDALANAFAALFNNDDDGEGPPGQRHH